MEQKPELVLNRALTDWARESRERLAREQKLVVKLTDLAGATISDLSYIMRFPRISAPDLLKCRERIDQAIEVSRQLDEPEAA